MKLIAKFVKALPVTEGETDRGHWMRGGMVVRTLDERETMVAFLAFGEEKTVLCGMFKTGDIVQVNFMPESREFDDKWFTDLRLLSVHQLGTGVQKGGSNE